MICNEMEVEDESLAEQIEERSTEGKPSLTSHKMRYSVCHCMLKMHTNHLVHLDLNVV